MLKFGLHPLFFLLGITLILFGYCKIFFIYLSVVILHEMAHAFVAKKLGYKLGKIFLQPFGVGLTLKQNFIEEKDEIYVALAGPLLNFCLAFLCIALWWIEPVLYNYTQEFVFANMVNGLINLLPCYPLDGGRIFVAFFSKKITKKKSLKICFFFNNIISILFCLLFFLSLKNEINITFALMAIFIFLGTIEDKLSGNYNLINIPIKTKKEINRFITPLKTFAVNLDTPIYKIAKNLDKNKYNLIYVILPDGNIKILTEKNLENLFLKYNPTTPLNKIFFR